MRRSTRYRIAAAVLTAAIVASTATATYLVTRTTEPDWTFATCESYSTDTAASLPPYTRTDGCVAADGTLHMVK